MTPDMVQTLPSARDKALSVDIGECRCGVLPCERHCAIAEAMQEFADELTASLLNKDATRAVDEFLHSQNLDGERWIISEAARIRLIDFVNSYAADLLGQSAMR